MGIAMFICLAPACRRARAVVVSAALVLLALGLPGCGGASWSGEFQLSPRPETPPEPPHPDFAAAAAAGRLAPPTPIGSAARQPATPRASRRPNIVFLLVDDLGWSDLACYGNTFNETPNIDRLAAHGVRFTQAYAASAVCSPTRAAIQTGKHPIRLGITDWIPGERHRKKPLVTRFTRRQLPLEEVTIAEALREHGYRTAYVGKWHLGGKRFHPQHQGYDVNIAGSHAGHPYHGYFSPYKLANLEDGPKGEYLTDRLTDESLKLLDRWAAEPDRPFFLCLAYYTVHMPIQSRPDLLARYRKKKAAHPDDPFARNPAYAGMVHALDESVGRILARLGKLGIADNTIVVFTSDNGGVDYARVTTNKPLRAGKGRYWEGGVRVPLIVRLPLRAGIPASEGTHITSDLLVASMDLYPTLLDVAGSPRRPRQHVDGKSQAAVLQGANEGPRKALFWHYPHYHGSGARPVSAARVGDYKFLRHYEGGRRELYDVAADVGETKNLIETEPEIAVEVEAKLDAWLKEVGAYIPVLGGPGDARKPRQPRPPADAGSRR